MTTDWASRRAVLTPGRPAIVDGAQGRVYTFRDFGIRVRKLCRWIETRGLQPGDRIAILAKNHVAHIDLWLLAGASGVTVWPMNWRVPAAELIDQAALVQPRLILYDEDRRNVAWAVQQTIPQAGLVDLAHYEEKWATLAEREPEPAQPGDAAMLLFTGGSTGRPKAVRITHRQIFYNAINTLTSWNLSGDDRAMILTPFYHTGGYHVLTSPLFLAGGTSVLFEGYQPDQALRALVQHRISVLFMVPTMFQAMADHVHFSRTDFSSLKFAISGGAPCPEPIRRRFAAEGISFRLGYGLTEVGPNCFAMPEEVSDSEAVGVPVFHLTARVVRLDGSDALPGETGELWLKGPTVAAGYDSNPEETAAHFDGEGFFHTGDLVRIDEDGLYRIVGRKKEMFISGGENVYPIEVETAMNNIPGVRASAVVGIPDETWGEIGVAFVVADGLTVLNIRERLKGRLARYKIPRRIVLVEALPETPAGKVDKRSLKELATGDPHAPGSGHPQE